MKRYISIEIDDKTAEKEVVNGKTGAEKSSKEEAFGTGKDGPKLDLLSPWMTHLHKIEAIFSGDQDIEIQFDNETCTVKILVHGEEKAEAISNIMPTEKDFGSVKMTIKVIPDNDFKDEKLSVFDKAFKGNPAFLYSREVPFFGLSMNYVVFKNKVVQFFNDDIGDLFGYESTLFEDIARDVFRDDLSVHFSTDLGENLKKK